MKIIIENVRFMPKELKPGVLYVSKEFSTAAHLCACGCMSKIRTPLGPTEWSVKVVNNKPSLYPSIGNWQIPCQSHYWIRDGEIIWASKWTSRQILEGRDMEHGRRLNYYVTKNQHFSLRVLINKIKSLVDQIVKHR